MAKSPGKGLPDAHELYFACRDGEPAAASFPFLDRTSAEEKSATTPRAQALLTGQERGGWPRDRKVPSHPGVSAGRCRPPATPGTSLGCRNGLEAVQHIPLQVLQQTGRGQRMTPTSRVPNGDKPQSIPNRLVVVMAEAD